MPADSKLGILESVMRSVKLGALVFDVEQRLVFWNRWVEQRAVLTPLRASISFADAFPAMVNGRTHAAMREALANNFPSLISQTLNKAPFPLYSNADDASRDVRLQQAIQVIPFDVAGLARHCLIQITDVSNMVMREKLLREQSAVLKTMSYTDGLTGIANRRHFDERLAEECARSRRSGSVLSLFMIDIDFFKAYNDSYGHLRGDHCLREVAQTLAGVLQRPGDMVARYGGEEFVAILPETDHDGAMRMAEAMRQAVEARALEHRKSAVGPFITVSIGVGTHAPTGVRDEKTLIEATDRGLYQAKKAGRNQLGSVNIGDAAINQAATEAT
jgi:diguanylate cyclase (GGDEF)-like protein